MSLGAPSMVSKELFSMSSIRVEQDLMKQAVVLSALFEAAEHHCNTPH